MFSFAQILFIGSAIYILVVLFLYLKQRSIQYHPEILTNPEPAAWDLPELKPIYLTTKDNLKLLAWYNPPVFKNRPVIIYFHGNAGHMGYRGKKVHDFLDEGFGLLMVSYRGYANNPGSPSEQGLYEDARAALSFIQSENVSLSQVILFGESLGTGVAVQMAIEYQIKILILQSPYTSMANVAKHHYPYFPFVKYIVKDKYDSLSKINKVTAAVLIIHGENDHVVPIWMGKKIYESINTDKLLLMVPKAAHNDVLTQEIMQNIISFINNRV